MVKVPIGVDEVVQYEGWDYCLKMANGLVILRYWDIENVDMTNPWGVLFEGPITLISKKSYPKGLFVDNPAIFIGKPHYGRGYSPMFEISGEGSIEHTPMIYGVYPYALAGEVSFSIMVVGRWK